MKDVNPFVGEGKIWETILQNKEMQDCKDQKMRELFSKMSIQYIKAVYIAGKKARFNPTIK